MNPPNGYSRIPLGAAEALTDDVRSHVSVFLPCHGESQPVLYREAGTEVAKPRFDILRANDVPFLLVRNEDLTACESLFENKLDSLLHSSNMRPEEKAQLFHQVGTSVARDLMHGPDENSGLERAVDLVDNVISCVLRDPLVSATMLSMTAHERTTASHMFVVSTLAIMLGREVYGPEQEVLRCIGLAGMLHDIGKLTISPAVLNKREPLTPEEIELIQQHPIESVRLLGDDPVATPAVRQMILQHHEWYNGGGYPLGVSGDDLLPGSRILSIVDAYHVMVGRRPYRKPLSPEEALRALQAQSERQFDPLMLAYWSQLLNKCPLDSMSQPEADGQSGEDSISTRQEHRSLRSARHTFGQRRPRHRCSAKTSVRCVYVGRLYDATAAPDEFTASLVDVSRGGLCILTDHPLYRGEYIHVEVDQGGRRAWVRARVSWCRHVEAGLYRTGAQFTTRVAETCARESVAPANLTSANAAAKPPNRVPEVLAIPRPVRKIEETEPHDEDPLRHLENLTERRHLSNADIAGVVKLASHDDPAVRQQTIGVLIRTTNRETRSALLGLLKDEDADVRESAAGAARSLEMGEAAHLLRDLLRDPSPRVALRAAGALGRLGERDGLPVAVTYLASEEPLARLAAQTLGDIVGHRFPANAEGIKSARRYLAANRIAAAAS